MPIPPLILKIVADSSGVKKGVAETNAQVSGLKSSVSANAALMKTALIGGVVVGLAAAAKAASDLGESQNKANVIFGDSVGLVNDFADTAASGFGISKAAALESAASFGAMFDSAGLAENAAADMSVTMTGLAGDMASFNNQDPSEMLDRLRSGLSGEAEPLRRFGVFISEARVQTEAYKSGIAEMGAELTDAQKIQARFNIIMQDTAKQQGDFSRTIGESLPNQIRALKAEFTNLAAEVGQHLLPVFLAVVKIVREIPTPVLAAGAALTTLAAATVAASTAMKAMEGTWLAKLIARLGPFGVAAAEVSFTVDQFAKTMSAASKDIEAADHAINTGRGGLVLWKDAAVEGADATDAVRIGMGAMGDTATQAARSVEVLEEQHRRASAAAREQRAAELALAGGLLGLVSDLETVRDAQQEVNKLKRQGKENSEEYRDAILKLASSSVSFQENLRDYVAEQKDANAATRDVVGGLVDLGKEFGFTRGDLEKILGPLDQYVAGLKGIPSKVHTDVSLTYTATSGGLPAGIVRGRQHGGPVSMGMPYLVGERGPELFVPSTSGAVVPNAGGGGGGDVVIQVGSETLARIAIDALVKHQRRNVTTGIR
jgi:hypothetical protein